MGGIEFVDDDGAGWAADDELARPPRGPAPRRLWLVVVAALVAIAAAAVVARSGDHLPSAAPTHPVPSARLSFTPPVPVVPVQRTVTLDPRGFEQDLELSTSSSPVLAVAASGSNTWVLRRDVISLVSPRATLTTATPAIAAGAQGATLTVDTRHGLVWAVFRGATGVRVVAYRTSTLRPVATGRLDGEVEGAAALDGRLYLAHGDMLIALGVHRAAEFVAQPRPTVALGQVVADPVRDRLLVASAPVDGQRDTTVWAVTGRGAVTARRDTHTVQASLAVSAGGAIWLAGRDDGAGILMALDPRTLAKSRGTALDILLAPQASLVAGGAEVVWVRDSTGPTLRCVDAATGEQLQSWALDGAIASAHGHAVRVVGTRASLLPLTRCRG